MIEWQTLLVMAPIAWATWFVGRRVAAVYRQARLAPSERTRCGSCSGGCELPASADQRLTLVQLQPPARRS